jgi:glycosyltransferase involved in cell wall biosynthesis
MRPLLALAMIVKNEAPNIRATLESVRPFVDYWAIFDTGSTDGTQEIIKSVMEGVPGEVYEGNFVDFATSRNHALDLVQGQADFSLMLSGDETLSGGDALRVFLEEKRDAVHGAYCIEMQSGSQAWVYPRILRVDTKWRYVGLVHEVPIGPNKETSGPVAPGVRVVHSVSDMSRRWQRMHEVDLPILTREVADESKSIEDRAQAIWHLGNTHEALADEHPRTKGGPYLSHKMAAMALYRRYTEISQDTEKVAYAAFRYLNVSETVDLFSHAELLSRLEPLAEAAPHLAELRYVIAIHAAQIDARRGLFLAEVAVKVAADAKNRPTHMPVDSRTEWSSFRLAAECAYQLKKFDRAKALAKRAIDAGAPADEMKDYLR